MGFVTSTTSGVGRGRQAAGFTLAESLLASAILAISAVAIVAPVLASRQQSSAADVHATAIGLARELIEEIAAKPLMNADGTTSWGPSVGQTTRSQYVCVGNYHGYADTSSGMAMSDGTAVGLPNDVTYSRSVTVEYRATPAGAAVVSGDFALVTVTVNPSKGPAVKLQQLMVNVPLKRKTNP